MIGLLTAAALLGSRDREPHARHNSSVARSAEVTGTEVARPKQGDIGQVEGRRAPVEAWGPRRLARATRDIARRTALGFAEAFTRFELGRGGRSVDRELGEFATARLAGALLAEPARRPLFARLPAPAEVGGVALLGPVAGRLKALVTVRSVAGRRVLELWLRRAKGEWLVDAVHG